MSIVFTLDFVKHKMLIYNRKDKIYFIEEASFKPNCGGLYADCSEVATQIFANIQIDGSKIGNR